MCRCQETTSDNSGEHPHPGALPVFSTGNHGHLWKPALEAAGVEPLRVNGFHVLRRHFAGVALGGGVGVRALAECFGHSDLGFILRTYTHLMPSGFQRMRKAVDRALGGEPDDGLA